MTKLMDLYNEVRRYGTIIKQIDSEIHVPSAWDERYTERRVIIKYEDGMYDFTLRGGKVINLVFHVE